MLIFEAYRRDLARLTGRTTIGLDDAAWLAASSLLERYAAAGPAERRALAPSLAGHLAAQGEDSVVAAGLRFASELEDAGALHLAAAWTALLERLGSEQRAVDLGRVVARRARLVHKLGQAETALALYQRVARLGETHAEPELTTRAWNGIALVAHVRGNHPEARRWYRAAALVADDTGCVEQACIAHQGLLILAAVARDFDQALIAGRRALAAAEYDRERLAEVLNNVAQVLHDMGRHAAALRGFGAVVNRTRSTRLVLAALGGAALAAAALGAPAIVAAAEERIARLAPAAWPYPHAIALLDLADAYRALGAPERAASFSARARALAAANGYHELEYRADRMPAMAVPRGEREPLGPTAVGLVSEFESLDAPHDLCIVGGRTGADQ